MFPAAVLPLALLLLVSFAGCASPGGPVDGTSLQDTSTSSSGTGSNTTAPPEDLRVLRGLDCELGSREAQEEALVARDNATYQEAWSRICSSPGREPPSQAPSVDFPRENALLYAWGTKPSSGYAVEILSIVAAESEVVVNVRRTSPGADCAGLTVITYPAAAVAVEPVPEMPLRWEFEDVTHACA